MRYGTASFIPASNPRLQIRTWHSCTDKAMFKCSQRAANVMSSNPFHMPPLLSINESSGYSPRVVELLKLLGEDGRPTLYGEALHVAREREIVRDQSGLNELLHTMRKEMLIRMRRVSLKVLPGQDKDDRLLQIQLLDEGFAVLGRTSYADQPRRVDHWSNGLQRYMDETGRNLLFEKNSSRYPKIVLFPELADISND
mmetsp:Transcript_18792/g.47249  ORF Transcript_18792/g.47249 Transcript_18792/m.47249 type:complete len:198 (-) Transcript_18792:1610-2203(-)